MDIRPFVIPSAVRRCFFALCFLNFDGQPTACNCTERDEHEQCAEAELKPAAFGPGEFHISFPDNFANRAGDHQFFVGDHHADRDAAGGYHRSAGLISMRIDLDAQEA